MNPQVAFLLNKSLDSLRQSNLDSAELFLKQALKIEPHNPHVLRLLGVIYAQQQSYTKALDYLNRSLEALPKNSLALSNLGNVYLALKKYEVALNFYDKSVKLDPNDEETWTNRGNVLYSLKRYESSIIDHHKAISLKPDFPEAWNNKGNALKELKLYEESILCFDKAISLRVDFYEAWSNKGNVLFELKRFEDSLVHHNQAINIKPNYSKAWLNKGNALFELKKYEEAIVSYENAIDLEPDYANAWGGKAAALDSLKQHKLSAICYLKAREMSAEANYFLGRGVHQMMLACDWTNYDFFRNEISREISLGLKSAEPFGLQGIGDTEGLLKDCATIYSSDKFPALENISADSKYSHEKIRIGYLCGEFREHATTTLMARIWELHDKNKFEIFAFDNGWDDQSDYRKRVERAFDEIYDISRLSDLESAKLVRSCEIDILVNLNGFFGLPRQGVFSYKPAPIQVNYLGFPGTIGAPYIDYIIADEVVIPKHSRSFYVEKIVYMPNSYQANDDQRVVADRNFSKQELGLPEDKFIFACFNNNYKILPATLTLWSKILKNVDKSILWLLSDNSTAVENLIMEFNKRGIDSSRLIFADRISPMEHLARHRLADLFLDTLPCNAHTTCSDSLWSGLPVLTLCGNTFSGRVSASLLTAIGMPELITYNDSDFESIATGLALNPSRLKGLRDRLEANISSKPLFDSNVFTRNIEIAYLRMVQLHRSGAEPENFSVNTSEY